MYFIIQLKAMTPILLKYICFYKEFCANVKESLTYEIMHQIRDWFLQQYTGQVIKDSISMECYKSGLPVLTYIT